MSTYGTGLYGDTFGFYGDLDGANTTSTAVITHPQSSVAVVTHPQSSVATVTD